MAKPRGTRTTVKNLPKGKIETWVSAQVKTLTSRDKKATGTKQAMRAIIAVCKTVTTTRYKPVD